MLNYDFLIFFLSVIIGYILEHPFFQACVYQVLQMVFLEY